MQKINKKGGAVSSTVIVAFLVIFLAIFGFVAYKLTSQQTIVPSATTTCTANSDCTTKYGADYQCQNNACVKITATGVSSTLYVSAYEREQDTDDVIGEPSLYMWESGNPTKLTTDAGTLSGSTSTAFSSGVTKGKSYKMIAFKTGTATAVYGDIYEMLVGTESETVNLDCYNATNGYDIDVYYQNSKIAEGLNDDANKIETNITIGASETIQLDRIEIKNNDTKSLGVVGGICFDTLSGNNLTSIEIPDMKPCTTAPLRLVRNAQCEYCFQFSEPKKLHEYNIASTGAVKITADTDDPANENFTMIVFDYAPYKALDNSIKFGFENDNPSPSDVGMGDDSKTFFELV